MARNNDTLKFTGLAVAVIAAAFGIGYYVLGGAHPAPAPTDTSLIPSGAPAESVKAASQAPPVLHLTPRTKNSDYTAPGAPSIRIAEERTPSLRVRPYALTPTADTVPPAHDTEASQEAAPPASAPDSTSSAADTSTPGATDTSTAPTSKPLIPPAVPAAPTPPAAPADQDYEQIGSRPAPEAGQDGASSGGKAQYRVQTGSFAAPENARALADALHSRGYSTSTRTEQDNGKTVYKVQVGSYRSRAAADKAAQDLQKNGYPAYSSPIGQ